MIRGRCVGADEETEQRPKEAGEGKVADDEADEERKAGAIEAEPAGAQQQPLQQPRDEEGEKEGGRVAIRRGKNEAERMEWAAEPEAAERRQTEREDRSRGDIREAR